MEQTKREREIKRKYDDEMFIVSVDLPNNKIHSAKYQIENLVLVWRITYEHNNNESVFEFIADWTRWCKLCALKLNNLNGATHHQS